MNDMFAQHNESIRLVRQEYEERKKTIEQSRTWSNGWTQAFNEYVDSATSAANLAAAQFNAFTRGMESAIDQFVESGKFSFGDFISSVIKDIAKAELKFAAAGFMKAMGMGGPGGSISGGIASWIGGFFAEGGTPPVGKPSVVGENGPELFIPKSAGTILPNGVMPQSQQQTPQPIINNTYVTNNIQAVDAKSVAQLFAENRKSLFGAVTQAKRELPGKFSAI
jgi:phage-related minor tail protein